MNQAVHERNGIEDSRLGGFRKIYPLNQEQINKYQPFFDLAYEVSDIVPERAKNSNTDYTKMYFHPRMDVQPKPEVVLKKDLSMKTTGMLKR